MSLVEVSPSTVIALNVVVETFFKIAFKNTEGILGKIKNKLLLEYWKKIFHPITTVLLTLLAASFIFGSVRDNSLGRRILIGILFAFSLNTIQSLFQSMASVSLLNPFNSVFFPMLIVLLITMVLWNLKTQES